jgi:hypothetical protein
MKKSYYRETAQLLLSRPRRLQAMSISSGFSTSGYTIGFSTRKPSLLKKLFTKKEPKIVPEPVNTMPAGTDFTKVYTSFCGCDIVMSFNDEVFGEISELSYHEISPIFAEQIKKGDYYDADLVEEYPVTLIIGYTIFADKKVYDRLCKNLPLNITITYANEYGVTSRQSIFDVIMLEDMSDMSIDSVTLEGKVLCAARKITTMSND